MYLLQNVYSSKERSTYIVSNKLFASFDAAIKELRYLVEDAITNRYSDFDEDCIDIEESKSGDSKCICGPDFMDAWFITNLDDAEVDESAEAK